MEYINQNLVHENYKYISPKSAIVVDVNEAKVSEVISRVLFQTGYVICVDFSSKKNKAIGVVSVADVKKYLSKYSEFSGGGRRLNKQIFYIHYYGMLGKRCYKVKESVFFASVR